MKYYKTGVANVGRFKNNEEERFRYDTLYKLYKFELSLRIMKVYKNVGFLSITRCINEIRRKPNVYHVPKGYDSKLS